MKVLRIIARLNIGGPAKNAILLTEGLKGFGVETILVCGEPCLFEGDMSFLAQSKKITPIIVKELGREISIWNDLVAFWKIYRIICRESPDIIHTHTAKAGALGRLAACLYKLRGAKCKIVHTFHGHILKGYFGKLRSILFLWIERFFALFTDKILTVSNALKKELEELRIAGPEKILVIELGFELDELLNLPQKAPVSGAINIGIVGRLVPIKNHRMFLEVARQVLSDKKWVSQPVKFIIIGDGELREALKSYAQKLGIVDSVEFRGWVREVKKIYEELDIVVLTSLNEGTPVSLIEAMAAGRGVVATDVGGVRDLVEDGINGYLVPSGNAELFVDRLKRLIEDAGKREQFGLNGREGVRARFKKERLLVDIVGLYNNLIGVWTA